MSYLSQNAILAIEAVGYLLIAFALILGFFVVLSVMQPRRPGRPPRRFE